MCLSICHKLIQILSIHSDCSPVSCRFADPATHGRCEDCHHKDGTRCHLTNATLPESGGCCHYNVEPIQGTQVIGLAQIQLLRPTSDQSVSDVLEDHHINEFILSPTGSVLLDLNTLSVPNTYGLGTDRRVDHLPDVEMIKGDTGFRDWDI